MYNWKKLYTGFLVTTLIALGVPQQGLAQDQLSAQQENMEWEEIQNTIESPNLMDIKNTYQKKQSRIQNAETQQIDLSMVNDRQIIIKWAEGKRFDASKFGLISLPVSDILKKENIYLVKVPESQDYQKTLRLLKRQADQVSVDPDYVTKASYVPTDAYFSKQWYLNLVNMPKAWDITKGSSDVTIAVLDTGVNANHPELKGRVLSGYDFVNNDADPNDDNGHGTFVSGVIAGNANQTGIVGVDLKAKILPIKVSNKSGTGSVSDTVKGIYYAIEHGAKVINMSYSSYDYSEVEAEAISDAYKHGIVLVAAAGNDNTENWSYPASYPEVISVGSTNEQDDLSSFSNYGEFLDLTAPGENIIGLTNTNGYRTGSGTSFSAPMVSGIASLILAKYPNWSPERVEWAMELSSKNIIAGRWNELLGFGRVDAYGALTAQFPSLQEDASDEWDEAEPVSLNQTVSDKIDMPMDDDWYQFDIPSQANITIQFTNQSDYLDLVGVLYQKSGDHLMEKDIIDNGDAGEDEKFTVKLQAGTYYLAIYDFFNHWSDDNYQLKISSPALQPDDSGKFPDISNHWARADIENLANQGLITGYPNGNFGPDDPITRASAATLISRVIGLSEGAETAEFADVPSNHWAYDAISAVENAGIMVGDEHNQFHPNARLTREEMAAILVRAFHLTGTAQVSFSDVKSNSWSYPYINTLVANSITVGFPDGTFGPKKHITRAEFVTMLSRAMKQNAN